MAAREEVNDSVFSPLFLMAHTDEHPFFSRYEYPEGSVYDHHQGEIYPPLS